MTQIHGNAPPRDRLDDSTVLQKRLLQDLERQWLDTWEQVRQLQAQAGAPMEASNTEADASGAVSASGLASGQGSGPAGAHSAATYGAARAESAASATGSEGGARLSQTAVARTGAAADGTSARRAATQSQAAGAPFAGARAFEGLRGWGADASAPVKDALPGASSREGDMVDVAAPGGRTMASATALEPLAQANANDVADAEALQLNVMASAALSSGSGWSAQAAVSGASSDPVLSMTAVASTPSEPAPLALLGKGLPSSVGEGEAESSAAARRRFAAASPDAEPASQHLMLRELNEQEVLASMRDAQLGSVESQVAAQELARALMQAGYARVQVVVNGHQRRLDDTAVEDGMASDGGPSAEPTPHPTSNIQSTPHGN